MKKIIMMKTTNFTHRQSKTRCCLFKSDLFVMCGKFKFMTKVFTYVINYGGIGFGDALIYVWEI